MSRFYGDFDPASTASTAILTVTSAVSLYLPFDTDFSDLSNFNHTPTESFNGAQYVQTSVAQFGGSAFFDNNDDYVTYDNHPSFIFGSEDFTVEGFFNASEVGNDGLIGVWGGPSSGLRCWLISFSNNRLYAAFSLDGNSATSLDSGVTISTGQWYNFSFTREGSTFRLFVDGVLKATATNSSSLKNSSQDLAVGSNNQSLTSLEYFGYLDDIRIIKGLAVYTTAYSVPTGPVGFITDTRSHSHVWNYSDVYDARFAGTWPAGPPDPTITFKVWGAGGGGTNADGSESRRGAGGAGGFAQGTVTAAIGTEFLLTVGSGGPHTTGSNNQQIAAGTYGGGGAGYAEEQDGGAGGGFSGVFTGSRTQGNAIIIAGGGGGGASYTGSSGSGGGGGGGETGRDGLKGNPGDGGSQSSGGAGGGGNATNGSALQGGRGGNKGAGQNRAGGGGGGGYHGGGGGGAQNNGGDGGGGSGYVGGNSSYTPSSTTNTQGGDGSNGASSSATGGAAPNSSDSDYVTNAARGGGADQSGYDGAIVVIVGETTTVYSSAGEFTFTVS